MIFIFLFLFFFSKNYVLRSLPSTFVFLIWMCAIWGFIVGHVHIQDYFYPYPDKITLSDLQWYRYTHELSPTERLTDKQIVELYDEVYWDTMLQRIPKHGYYGGLMVLSAFALMALFIVGVDGRDLWY